MKTRKGRRIASAAKLAPALLLLLMTAPSHAQTTRPHNESFMVDLGPAQAGTLLALPSILQPIPPLAPSELQGWPDPGNSAFGAAYWLTWTDYDVQNTGFSVYRRAADTAFPSDLRASRVGEFIHPYGVLTSSRFWFGPDAVQDPSQTYIYEVRSHTHGIFGDHELEMWSQPVRTSVTPGYTPQITSFVLFPAFASPGTPVTGIVTLSQPAPFGGSAVALDADPEPLAVPEQVVVLPGSTTGAFFVMIFTHYNAPADATVVARIGNQVATAKVTVQ